VSNPELHHYVPQFYLRRFRDECWFLRALFEQAYKPVLEGGLGLYTPWFWRQAFGFPGPRVKTLKC
jgi:hypothetical protein